MDDALQRMPQPGERWYKDGWQEEAVIISELYYPAVRCPYHTRPDVRFIHEATGKIGSMALRAFLIAYMDKATTFASKVPCSDRETTRGVKNNATSQDNALSDPFKKWKEADSRRFSRNQK
ncbi:hypothetical protein [Klebsiella variicola]|uniref:hypothetical protein n=1 Tax=Klebsiella variicola TaxID=244366 RepID=UPI000E1FC165|nr:hypothetical protein [Klebsiella variicola]